MIAEAIVKIIGLRFHYFTVPWNLFDFLLVVASILGILMEDIMIDFPVSPTLLRVVRVFRIGRILRLIKVSLKSRPVRFFALLMTRCRSLFLVLSPLSTEENMCSRGVQAQVCESKVSSSPNLVKFSSSKLKHEI
jgi:hypothetical protein